MLRTLKCPVIALEEHYWDKELAALFVGAVVCPHLQSYAWGL